MPRELTLRFSELATLAECQLKYKLAYAERLTGDSKARLVLGTAFHALLEGHYKAFAQQDAAFQQRDLVQARQYAGRHLNVVRQTSEGKHIDEAMLDQLRWMYEGFIEVYGTDPDYDRIISVEQRRVVKLVSHLGVRVNLGVTADLIVHHAKYDKVLLVDHKTLSGRDAGKAATAKENQLDLQRGVYTASYSRQGPKRDRIQIFGALHNTIRTDKLQRTMLLAERYGRAAVYFNDRELDAIWEEAQNLARDAVEIRLGRGRAKRLYSSPDPQVCSWKCQFKEPHLTSRATGRDPVQVALDYGFRRADADDALIGTLSDG